MKKTVLALGLFTLVVTANADDDKVKRLTNFYTGVMFAPEYNLWKSNETVSANSGFSYKNQLSYSTGLDFVKFYGDKLGVSAGAYFTSTAFERTDHCYTCDVEYEPVSTFYMKGISIPLSAYYMLLNDRFDLYLIGGFSNRLYTSIKEERVSYQGRVDLYNPDEKFNKLQIGLNTGVGMNYNISYRWSIGLNLLYRSSFIPITESPVVRFCSLSANTGFYYKF